MSSNNYIVRTLDGGGDWTFGAGLSNFSQNNDAVAQDIAMSLRMIKGNCFFALSAGPDWFNLLGGKSLLAISLAVNAALLSVNGVTGILQSTPVLTGRALSLTYSVQTLYGTLQDVFVYDGGVVSGGNNA